MDYLEPLPPQCPPDAAIDQAIPVAYRVVGANPATSACFESQAAKNRPLLEIDNACSHRSCSMFTSFDKASNIASRLPKPRESGPLIATVTIPTGAGRSKIARKHIDLWFYKSFNPTASVLKIEEL